MVGQTLPLSIPRSLPRESQTLVAQPSAESFYKQGLAKAKSEDFEGAIQVIRLDPEAASSAYSKRAIARDRMGDRKGASEDRQQAAKLPKEPEIREFRAIGAGPRSCDNPASSSP